MNTSIPAKCISAFIFTIFLSAFLLFQIQPIIARFILPWYGGSPSVWTTCLLFFQLGLVLGYAYSHFLVLVLRKHKKLQVGLHFLLLLIVLLTLPISPSEEMRPGSGDTEPIWGIIKLLTLTVGFPYVLLSASGPLIQHWYSETYPGRSPFRLYAVSNLGSLLALLSYPFLFEPLLTVTKQALLWSGGFMMYALLLAITATVYAWSKKSPNTAPVQQAVFQAGIDEKPKFTQILRWIAFSACGSLLLLSITNQMCQDVAVVPFLWVVPLALYLLSFVIAFDHSRWYSRPFTIMPTIVVVGTMIVLMNRQYEDKDWPLLWQIVIYCSSIFFTCLICHGEIVRIKPPAKFLTGFYLAISIGGALGGIFVNLVAPQIFTGYWELHFGLGLLALLTTIQLYPRFISSWRKVTPEGGISTGFRRALVISVAMIWCSLSMAMIAGLQNHVSDTKKEAISSSRGFFGVLHVNETHVDKNGTQVGEDVKFRSLYHGRINHGQQFTNPKYRRIPTTYFNVTSGVAAAFEYLPQRRNRMGQSINVGVIGLGVGTLATYASSGDQFRFYEINPQVETVARSHFTYLDDCRGDVSVVLGDGRISLERELEQGINNQFDILVVDAFSGDSIPIHLLTYEAFKLYAKHLKDDGVLAVHITNRHFDLSDPVRLFAAQLKMSALRMTARAQRNGYYSDWILLTKNNNLKTSLLKSGRVSKWARPTPKKLFWTDNYSNLIKALY